MENPQPMDAPIWRGMLNISRGRSYVRHEIAAYISGKACAKVHTAAQQFPGMLRSEVVGRHEVWPKRFSVEPPISIDIALYFFPEKREDQLFESLVAHINIEDLGIRVLVDNAELLIFSSLQLPQEHQMFDGKVYLWGVFRCNQSNASHPTDLDTPEPPVDAGVGEVDHHKISKNVCWPMTYDQPPATKPSLLATNELQVYERGPKLNVDQIAAPHSSLADAQFSSNDPSPEDNPPEHGRVIVEHDPVPIETDLPEKTTENLCQVSSSQIILSTALMELDEIEGSISTKLHAIQSMETSSIAGMGIKIDRYYLKPSLAPILRSIIEKYGDIAKHCPLPDCTNILERICEVVKNFQAVSYKKLKEHHLDSLNTIIIEARRASIDVDWLQDHHYKLQQTFLILKKFPHMKQTVRKKIQEAESIRGALMSMEDDSSCGALKSQLDATLAEIRSIHAEMSIFVTNWKHVREKFLMEGLL